ncbi:MAG: VOC family protein [Pseudomonadota bacterium]
MKQTLSAVALVVPDYDEAIRHYVNGLGFTLIEDTQISAEKRWVVVAPPGVGPGGCRLVLAKASNEAQKARIGDQTGGRVFLFLETDDFARDYERFRTAGVRFTEDPRDEPYGKVVVFEDAFGNRWDLIHRK